MRRMKAANSRARILSAATVAACLWSASTSSSAPGLPTNDAAVCSTYSTDAVLLSSSARAVPSASAATAAKSGVGTTSPAARSASVLATTNRMISASAAAICSNFATVCSASSHAIWLVLRAWNWMYERTLVLDGCKNGCVTWRRATGYMVEAVWDLRPVEYESDSSRISVRRIRVGFVLRAWSWMREVWLGDASPPPVIWSTHLGLPAESDSSAYPSSIPPPSATASSTTSSSPPLRGRLRRCGAAPRSTGWPYVGSLEKNNALVEYLKQYGAVRTDKVAECDNIHSPHMHATCLELLKDHLQPGMHALDVGSGSGYVTACFAMMVGPEGRAVGIEHIPELVAASTENVQRSAAASLLKDGSLSFHVSDGRLGLPDAAPYDAIHVGAAAPEIPQPLLEQLKPGGRMVIPVGSYFQDLQVVDKKADGSISFRNDASVRYVPLTSRYAQLRDS